MSVGHNLQKAPDELAGQSEYIENTPAKSSSVATELIADSGSKDEGNLPPQRVSLDTLMFLINALLVHY